MFVYLTIHNAVRQIYQFVNYAFGTARNSLTTVSFNTPIVMSILYRQLI